MVVSQLRGELRQLIGNPPQNQVPDRDLDSFIVPSLQWLAGYLKMNVVTDQTLALVAEQREYVLPQSLIYFCWVQVAGKLLDPTSVWALNSGSSTIGGSTTSLGISNSGLTWMTIPSGTPAQYAVQGRSLVMYPPASADFVANNAATFSWRYISSGVGLTSTGLVASDIASLTDLDLQCVRWNAAKEWIAAHMLGSTADQIPAMQATIAEYEKAIAARLPECKRHWENIQLDDHKTLRVEVGGRYGSAR